MFGGCATVETGAAIRLGRLTGVRTITDLATNLLLSAAVFAGAFVSGLAGFAFSVVAGAVPLRIFQPLEAVPLMMACSIGVQAANLWALRRNIQWGGSALLIAGGALGILAFRNINEVGFRRTILVVLLFSGASLAFA
jgi:hypothetical protein